MTIPAIILIYENFKVDPHTGEEEKFTNIFFKGHFHEVPEEHEQTEEVVYDIEDMEDEMVDRPPYQDKNRRCGWRNRNLSRQQSESSLRPPMFPRRSVDSSDFLESSGISVSTFQKSADPGKKQQEQQSNASSSTIRRIRSDLTEKSFVAPRKPERLLSIKKNAISAIVA